MISGRQLARDEIDLVWTIDRSEIVEAVYYVDDGSLQLRSEHHDVRGWPPGEREKYTPILTACHDRGGWLYGLFDEGRLIGAAVLDGRFIGEHGDQLLLEFLHVSASYRHRGLGRQLFALAQEEAIRRGARRLYISATPSRHTVDLYLRLGCTLVAKPDPELFAIEPEDIHLELALSAGR